MRKKNLKRPLAGQRLGACPGTQSSKSSNSCKAASTTPKKLKNLKRPPAGQWLGARCLPRHTMLKQSGQQANEFQLRGITRAVGVLVAHAKILLANHLGRSPLSGLAGGATTCKQLEGMQQCNKHYLAHKQAAPCGHTVVIDASLQSCPLVANCSLCNSSKHSTVHSTTFANHSQFGPHLQRIFASCRCIFQNFLRQRPSIVGAGGGQPKQAVQK